MILKKKKKKDPQRLKHKVRFNIEFDYKEEDNHKSKPLIAFVQAGSISEKKFFIGDLIKSINGIQVKTGEDLDNETNKLNWGDEVFFEVERKNKIEKVNIKTISFDHYKKNSTRWAITAEKVGKSIKLKDIGIEYNLSSQINDGDTLIAINSEKITSMDDFDRARSKYKVGDVIEYKIQKAKEWKSKIVNVKLISFNEAIKINKKSCKDHYNKKAGSLLFKEWEESDYGLNHEDWNKRREEIFQLEIIAERFSEASLTEANASDLIRNWKNKDAKLINKLVKPEYKDINFKLSFYSLIFNTKIIEKLKSISLKNECCYSFILTGKAVGGDWNRKVPENISNFEKLLSVKDKKKELLFDKISEITKSYFFNLMVDKKKEIKIKYISKKNKKSEEKFAVLSTQLNSFGFEDISSLLTNWFEKKYKFNKAKARLAISDWSKSFFLEYPEFTNERIEEIKSMDLQDEVDPDVDNYEDEYQDNKAIYVSTSVKKKKINGKDSFVVKLNNLPDDDVLQKLENEGKKIYLKIYVFDITDLEIDKYYEIQNTTGDTNQYFLNNCHVIKTEDFSWSEGNNILVQSKKLKPYGEISNELAFPYSVMQLPKYGKRKLSFRTFICTETQKFDENDGRFISYEHPSFRAEEYYIDDYQEYGFDEDAEYSEILSYTSSEIEIEYKQPGYLEVNRRKYNDLKLALSFALTQNEEENLKGNFEKIKEDIRYDGGFEAEINIYKTLNLKKNYEEALDNKIKLDDVLKDLKKNSVIHERYEIIDFLLNLATKDESFSKKENNFIDKVSKELELNKEKYQEIKKQKTASIKFVDFGDKAGESVFGITKEMSNEEKLKTLRKEYSRWNALTNNTDKAIRERAREMRDLAANLRSQYTK